MSKTKDEGKKLKKIDFVTGEFVANGNRYFIESDGICMERYIEEQKLGIEIGFGATYQSMFESIKECYGMVNEQKFADAAVILHNQMQSISDLENRRLTVIEYCALWINKEGEDRTVYDPIIMREKIADWKKEGIDIMSFFQVAALLVSGLKENYENLIKVTSTKEPKQEQSK